MDIEQTGRMSIGSASPYIFPLLLQTLFCYFCLLAQTLLFLYLIKLLSCYLSCWNLLVLDHVHLYIFPFTTSFSYRGPTDLSSPSTDLMNSYDGSFQLIRRTSEMFLDRTGIMTVDIWFHRTRFQSVLSLSQSQTRSTD